MKTLIKMTIALIILIAGINMMLPNSDAEGLSGQAYTSISERHNVLAAQEECIVNNICEK